MPGLAGSRWLGRASDTGSVLEASPGSDSLGVEDVRLAGDRPGASGHLGSAAVDSVAVAHPSTAVMLFRAVREDYNIRSGERLLPS